MARSIPVPIRQAILRGFKKGNSIYALAGKFQVAERTVRHLVRCFQDQANLAPAYDRCGRPKASPSTVIKEAMYLRQQHARWGAALIRVMLQEKYGKAEVPGTRTLQRWLRRLREKPAPPGRRPARESRRARRPHEIWQMDAAEQKRLKTGKQISWLRVVDDCSGAVLGTVVFPPRELEPSARGANPQNAAEIIRALRFAAGATCG